VFEKLKNLKKENIYLALALIFGLAVAIFNPPFDGVPDEHAHYWKAWSVAEGNLVCHPDNQIPKSAIELPDNILKVSVPGSSKKIVFNGLLVKLVEKDSGEMATGGSAICGATPLGYIPQAIGLKIGQTLHLSALADFYLARLLNLLASILLVYWAIRIIPFGKIVLLLIGLLPMTIQQFSSLSYDSLHIASTFLFIAYVLKLACEKDARLSGRQIITLLVIALFGFNVKTGYFLLSFLVFILPVGKFKDKKQYWLFTIGFVLINTIIFLGLYKYFQGSGDAAAQSESAINASRQMAYVLNHPVDFFSVLFNQVYDKFNFYMETFLFKSGWLKNDMPQIWYVFVMIGMFLLARNEKETIELTKKQRFIFLFVFLMNFVLVYLGLYLAWTKVSFDKISGVQGRYFLGIFPLLLLFFYKSGFSFKFEFIRKHIQACIIIFFLAAFLFVFQNIYEIYYDKTPEEATNTVQIKE
jgi:uncharacterized membrane protein